MKAQSDPLVTVDSNDSIKCKIYIRNHLTVHFVDLSNLRDSLTKDSHLSGPYGYVLDIRYLYIKNFIFVQIRMYTVPIYKFEKNF